MKFACVLLLALFALAGAKRCSNKRTNSKLICYYSEVSDFDACMCTHVILPENSAIETIETVREKFKGGSVLLTVREFNEDLVNILKNTKVDGLEINLKKLDDKNDVPDFISTVKSKLGSDLYFAISIPPKAEILAKYYDLKALTKHADLFILQTAFLGASHNVTFHPSRLSGQWDMQNTDSVVDLVSGMGAPLSKLVITSPVQAFQFTLQNEAHTAPGSPALEIKSLTREELCSKMTKGSNWTLERDQDQTGPYIFRKKTWIAFDDVTSMDIKAKYSRVRGLAGLALKDLSHDGGDKCGLSLLEAAYNGLSKQTRAPRGAVLQSLEREILETPSRPLDTIQVSPYRISRVIDVEGNVHSIRQDTRTEFECARQGYYVHPRSCGRFYRCVKFDQLSDDFNVFEFDCPAGLSFDSRYEVCVWPGSLPYSSACSGSSEIAPVPRTRFVCPGAEGYYADPENCRWFFACLDHGKSPLSAYEFRCPFGLVFDQDRLLCEWPWMVPRCASGDAEGFEYGSHAAYGGARLDNYDGLGALGVVSLGGLSGSFIQPQAKIYSSVSGGGVGVLHGQNGGQGAGLAFGNLGYTGSAHHATSGLSDHSSSVYHGSGIGLANAGQSITHGRGGSGLLSGVAVVDDSLNAGHTGSFGNSGASFHSTFGSGNTNSFRGGTVVSHGTSGAVLENVGVQGASYQANIDYGQDAVLLHGGSTFGLRTNNVHSSGGNLVGDGVSGLRTTNIIDHGVTLQQPGAILTSSGGHGQHGSSNYQFQENLAQLSAAIHGNIGSQKTVVTAAPVEKIHIVGGFSAVGTGNLKSGIEVSQNGLNINGISHVTPAPPVAVSTVSVVSPSPVVAVAAAPVPVVKSDIETYEGGVVANVPELQYKIVAPNANNIHYESSFNTNSDYSFSRGVSGIANISHNLINYASSTPVPVTLSTVNYDYYTPAVSFVQASTLKPLVTIGQTSVVHGGYHYPKPTVAFEEEPIRSVRPAAVSSFNFAKHSSADNVLATNIYTASAPAVHPVQPVVSSYNFQNSLASKSEGYRYTKPTVAFEENPVQIIQPVQPAVVSSFSINSVQKPVEVAQPVVSVTPTVPVIQHNVQPALVSSYSFQNHDKNEAAYLKTVQPVVSVTPTVPIIQQNVQPAVVTGYNYQTHAKNENYQYTDSAAAFKAIQPVVSVTPTVPVIHQNVQPAVISSYSFQNHANSEGYQYSKPAVSIKTVEPVVSVTPIVPIIQQNVHPVQPAVVSSFSFQNLARNEDYKQIQPVQSLVSVTPSTPIIKHTLQQQPAVISSYSFHNTLGKQQTIPVASAPVIQHNIQPIQHNIQPIQPAIVSSYNFHNVANNEDYKYTQQSAPVPTTGGSYSFQTIVGNEGYNKQIVPIQPVQPVVQHKVHPVQPAVVSSYSFQNVDNEDYSKRVTIQPVQPTIVSSYSFGSAVDNEAYKYTKQTFPIQPVVSVTPVVPVVHHESQPAVVSSYNFQNEDHAFSKQIIPVQPVVSVTPRVPIIQQTVHSVQPSIVSSFNFHNLTNTGSYKYNNQHYQPVTSVTPIVPIFQENVQPAQPAIVSSYNFQNLARNEGYDYSKQAIQVQPIQTFASVTPVVPVIKQAVQPAVVSSYSFSNVGRNENYDHSKQVTFEARPVQPAVVSSFNIQKSLEKDVIHEGYSYPQPNIAFEEIPLPSAVPLPSVTPIIPVQTRVQSVTPAVVSSYSFQNAAVTKNADFIRTEIKPIQPVQPAVVSSFSIHNSAESQGYTYNKPNIVFEEKPIQPLKPAVVSSYNIFPQSTVKPFVAVTPIVPIVEQKIQPVQPIIVSPQVPIQKTVVSSAGFGEKLSVATFQKPITIEDTIVSKQEFNINHRKPVVVASTNFKASGNVQNTVAVGGYDYPKPSISFNEGPVVNYENRQPVQEVPFVAKKAYVTGYQQQSQAEVIGYNYPKPAIAFEEVPVRVQSYLAPVATSTVKYEQVSLPVNPFQEYIQPSRSLLQSGSYRGRVVASTTPIYVENYSYSTPRTDIYISTPAPFKARGRARVNVNTYDDLYVSTPKPTYTSTVAAVLGSKSQPFQFYDSRLQSTPRPLLQSTVSTIPYVTSTQRTPISKYSFNEEYQLKLAPTPRPAVISTTTQNYIDDSIAISTPTRTYVPVKTVAEEYVVTPKSPVYTSESKPKTYVRVNDFHPFLSAKLGAQCTCRSNTVTLRRKPIATPPPYTNGDDDGYAVKSSYVQQPIKSNVVIPVRSGAVLENYAYEPQRILDVTPNPLLVIQSTTNAILPVPIPSLPIRKRVRVRPVTTPATIYASELPVAPVTYAPEIFLRKAVTPVVPVLNPAESRLEVGRGVNLVQSSAKISAKEALSSNTFDRYGPGGWRSRQETLQGTIDCQRAGLFRHPEQCNKFYACRWDCTKKRFTLHIFNCPVQLTFDSNVGACNWPSQGPACAGNTLLPNE